MTTNIDRAAEVVAREYAAPDLWKSTVDPSVLITQALADAGLLAPDLPEKEQDGRWKVSCKHLPISHTSTAGNQVTLRTSYGWWHTDISEARSLALALLAAADYAERNQA